MAQSPQKRPPYRVLVRCLTNASFLPARRSVRRAIHQPTAMNSLDLDIHASAMVRELPICSLYPKSDRDRGVLSAACTFVPPFCCPWSGVATDGQDAHSKFSSCDSVRDPADVSRPRPVSCCFQCKEFGWVPFLFFSFLFVCAKETSDTGVSVSQELCY